jgi:hypothetical protein
MNRRFALIVGLIILMTTLACNFVNAIKPRATEVSRTEVPGTVPSGLKVSITMAEDVEANTKNPVHSTNTYNPKATFHAVVTIENAPEGTKFEAVWYARDVGKASSPNTKIDSAVVTTGGSRNIDFSLQPNEQWPAGTYSVEIYVNGVKESEASFSVQ